MIVIESIEITPNPVETNGKISISVELHEEYADEKKYEYEVRIYGKNSFQKNVRQIGNVCDSPKIYVEDYVDTFLNQLCDKMEEEPRVLF